MRIVTTTLKPFGVVSNAENVVVGSVTDMTKYEQHIQQLCEEHDIEINYVDRDYSCNIYFKQIWIRRSIRSVKTYITALHEIGHILNEHADRDKNLLRDAWNYRRNKKENFTTRYCMMKEIDAWRTAFSLAKWTNPTAIRKFIIGISSYLQSYDDCHKKPMNLDYVCERFRKLKA